MGLIIPMFAIFIAIFVVNLVVNFVGIEFELSDSPFAAESGTDGAALHLTA